MNFCVKKIAIFVEQVPRYEIVAARNEWLCDEELSAILCLADQPRVVIVVIDANAFRRFAHVAFGWLQLAQSDTLFLFHRAFRN